MEDDDIIKRIEEEKLIKIILDDKTLIRKIVSTSKKLEDISGHHLRITTDQDNKIIISIEKNKTKADKPSLQINYPVNKDHLIYVLCSYHDITY